MSARTMEFIGVTTSGSSILGLFPRWAEALGIGDAILVGRDLALDADPAAYREVIDRIAADPAVRGALVTTHKVGLFAAAGDRFDDLDRYARLCGEVSCIAKRGERLVGYAKDPVTAQRALSALLGPDHFARTGAHALCLGAGGAGLALAVHLLERADRPARLVMTDTRPERLEAIRAVHDRLDASAAGVALECVPVPGREGGGTNAAEDGAGGGRVADALLADLPRGSFVVNATGMGKDRPGSPVSDRARFPEGAVVWDLNYRGELTFLRQARRQADEGEQLRVEDGWLYFLHGWSEHMAEVYGLVLTPELFDRLRAIADAWGGRS